MSTTEGPLRVLKDLGVTALLGSDRSARTGETPATLLSRAAVSGMRARAGRRIRASWEAIAGCPVDTHPAATTTQAATLERLLSSPDAALIHDWCVLARARGVRVPPVFVPALLDWWSRQPSRSPEVFDATGTCGAWLAELNPEWQRPVAVAEIPADADEAWQSGSSAERAALLATVRKNDAERALAMVRATWDADGAEERRKFIEVLGHHVSASDEPFLESALDDRSKTVRREAVRVLTRLAGSALRSRMRERAAGMLIVEKSKGGLLRRSKSTVTLEPPKTFDKAWERDGIEEQAAAGKGKRAFWMVQVLSATDLAAWTASTGHAPSEVLAALGDDEYFGDALGAMISSIAACPDQPDAAAWSEAVVSVCAGTKGVEAERLSSIWGAQAVERSEALRLQYVVACKAMRGAGAWNALASDPRAWSPEFSTRAVKILRGTTPKKPDSWEFWSPIESVSKLLHPGTAELFESLLMEMYSEGLSDSIRKSLDRVRLRAEMHKEFQS